MNEFLALPGGRIAYDVTGGGPLLVCVPGMGDMRANFRFLTPRLAEAGYRVATMDIRGHGESSTGWDSYTQTSIGTDILALIRHLGGRAVGLGLSFPSGSAFAAAAEATAHVPRILLLAHANGPPNPPQLLTDPDTQCDR